MNRKSLLSALCLLGGSTLIAIGWWDYWNPGQINQWWAGERIYSFYWMRLAQTLVVALPLALVAWWLGVLARAPTDYASSAQRRRHAACGFAAGFAIPLILLLKYQVTWLGINHGSSIWTYAFILVLSAVVTWLVWPALRNERLATWLDRQGPMIVSAGIVVYAVVLGGLAIARHSSFGTEALDLGTVDQAIWNTSRGRLLEYTPMPLAFEGETTDLSPHSRLADGRLELILLPLSAFYWLWADPRWLMALQAIVLAGGAIPLYHLARTQLADAAASTAITLAYLIYLPLHVVTMAGFNPSALMIPFLLWAWQAAERGRWRNYYIAVFIALFCGIDAAIALLGVGVYFLLRKHTTRRHGALTMLLSSIWLALNFGLVVPLARSIYASQTFRGYEGDIPLIVGGLLTQPQAGLHVLLEREKIQALVDLLAALGWVPMLAPLRLLPALPVLIFDLLTASPHRATVLANELAPAISFVFIAAVGGGISAGLWVARLSIPSAWLGKRKGAGPELSHREGSRLASLFALTTAFLVGLFFSPLPPGWGSRVGDYFQAGEHKGALARTLDLIPADAVVSAQNSLFPHLSQRPTIYLFPTIADAEYVAVDLDYSADKTPLDERLYSLAVDGLLADQDFHVVAFDNGALLFKRGSGDAPPGFAETLADYREGLYRSAIVEYRGPTRLSADDMVEVDVMFENRGTQRWETAGPYPINLSYHWWTPDGMAVDWYGVPTALGQTVEPGEVLTLPARFVTPSQPGDYVLEWDLVHEDRTWFGDQGSITLRVNVSVE